MNQRASYFKGLFYYQNCLQKEVPIIFSITIYECLFFQPLSLLEDFDRKKVFGDFLKIFLMWTDLKSLLNLLQYCFCIMFWFFGHEACGILAPRPGIEPSPSALEGEVLTTGPPGKSLVIF